MIGAVEAGQSGRDVDDRPPVVGDQAGELLGEEEDALERDPDEAVEVGLGESCERFGDLRAGVVDEDVEGLAPPGVAQRVGDARDERVERLGRAGVELQRDRLATQRGDLVDDGCGLVGVGAVGEDDVDAVAGKRECGAAPDAAVGAGDECDAR